MLDDSYAPMAEAYALGALDPADHTAFEGHLGGCEGCRKAVSDHLAVVDALPSELPVASPAPAVRQQLLDLAEAPSLPLDLEAFDWNEVVPGVRVHVMKEDAQRGVRACLVWARPGARHPRHRHLGDEVILVLKGAIGDENGEYGPGEICRSRPGSIHSEEVRSREDCICYVVYYGDLQMLEPESSS